MLQDEFARVRQRCIDYSGHTVCLYEELQVPERCSVRIRVESSNSEWRQGFWIGQMVRNSRMRLAVGKTTAPSMVIWADTCPPEFDLLLEAPDGVLHFYNVWNSGRGQSHSQQDGAGMLREELGSGLVRYRCNDGHAEATFNHLVFSLQVSR